MREWRLLSNLEYEDPYLNLAMEEAISIMVGKGVVANTVRFWRNPNTVVIGRYQYVELEVNLEACKKYGTTIIRRHTGGGTVYHDLGNLNYSFAINKNHPLVQELLFETIKTLTTGIVEGLRIMGINAEYIPSRTFIQTKGGKKLSGTASYKKREVFFHHGTLLVSSNLKILTEVLDVPNEKRIKTTKKYVRSIKSPVTNILDELGRKVSFSEVKESLVKGIEKVCGISLVEGKITKEEEEIAKKLVVSKFGNHQWNFGK